MVVVRSRNAPQSDIGRIRQLKCDGYFFVSDDDGWFFYTFSFPLSHSSLLTTVMLDEWAMIFSLFCVCVCVELSAAATRGGRRQRRQQRGTRIAFGDFQSLCVSSSTMFCGVYLGAIIMSETQ